jgi:hypothetical protein
VKQLEETILKAYKSGMKLREIAEQLNAAGFKNSLGKPYCTSAVSYIANSKGLRRYKKHQKSTFIRRAAPEKPTVDNSQIVKTILECNADANTKMTLLKALGVVR